MRGLSRAARFERLQRYSDGPFPALTIRYARRYLADYPRHAVAWLLLGMALTDLARYEEAEQAISKAIRLFPSEHREIPISQMGRLFRESGDYDRSVRWFRKAIKVAPGDATYQIFLGAVLAKQGRLQEAEEAHRAATTCAEGCIDEAYLNLGLVLRAQERFEEASECLREAIRLDPAYRLARLILRDVEKCIELEKSPQ